MNAELKFPEDWKPPRELSRSTPREVRLAGGGFALVILGGLCLLAAFAILVFLGRHATHQQEQKKALAYRGQETTAEIARLWRDDNKEHSPMASYDFSYNGQHFRGSVRTPENIWRTLAPGSKIPVRFLPDQPNINHPSDWAMDVLPTAFPPALATGLAVIPALMWFMSRRLRVLLVEGLPAPGIVTKVSRTKDRWAVGYQFRQRNGALGKGRGHLRLKPEVGASICVVYHPDNPRRNHLYPLEFYKVAE